VCEEYDCGYLSAAFFFRSAIRAYQQVLYLDTQFSRRADIHLRLGLIYKHLRDYTTSLKHLQRALVDPTGGCSLAHFELSYLIGFIFEEQGNFFEAQNIYEKLLEESLTLKLEEIILQQLGCLYFKFNKENQINKAILTLENACKSNPNSGLTYYYLGRCYSEIKNHTEAFNKYKNCVEKLDQNADVWCSIGLVIFI
jgi:histone demethylase